VKHGGVIIMLSKSGDGHGGEQYYRQFRNSSDLNALLLEFRRRKPEQTKPDQWQTQIQIRALQKATVLYVSDADDRTVRDMRMIPASSVGEALHMADELLGQTRGLITVIPDAVSVMFQPAADGNDADARKQSGNDSTGTA
ncbi:MAG: hypothetical protein IH607_00565, partial [Firmicutes bacterium]|nr:hypothetical protein [Bacillota bacterium]